MSNLGNTCFLNSVMQCLTHTKPLLLYCASREHIDNCKKRESCFLCHYSKFVDSVLKNQRTTPELIVNNLRTIWTRYRKFQQEDAHEFLILILESFINSCFQVAKPVREYVNKNQFKTPILKIFGGKSRSQVHCLGCGYKSNTYEDLITLSLDIPIAMRNFNRGPPTFESCLNQFCSSETLSGANKYMCSGCKKKCDAKKRFSIEQSPRILIVHFKRFDAFRNKISAKIPYPATFSLKEFMSKSIDSRSDSQLRAKLEKEVAANPTHKEYYDLFGVVVH